MTKLRLPAPAMRPPRRSARPIALNLILAALLAYIAWMFYRTPALAGFLLQAVRNSLGL